MIIELIIILSCFFSLSILSHLLDTRIIVEKYFSMSRKQCKEALDIYKKFVVRMDGVANFLRTAEVMWSTSSDSLTYC